MSIDYVYFIKIDIKKRPIILSIWKSFNTNQKLHKENNRFNKVSDTYKLKNRWDILIRKMLDNVSYIDNFYTDSKTI